MLAPGILVIDVLQYEALRRVHLIPPGDTVADDADSANSIVFRDLDSKVSEAGENFSTGYGSTFFYLYGY